MGNTARGFLVILLTLILPLVIFLNLMAFGNIGPFADLQEHGDVYFGVSSFITSLRLFEGYFGLNDLNSFFSVQHFQEDLYTLFNLALGGLPKLISYFTHVNDYSWEVNFDWNSFPGYDSAPRWQPENILEALEWIIQFFNGMYEFVTGIWNWLSNSLSTYFRIIVSAAQFMLAPIFVIGFSIYLICYILFFIGLILMWFLALAGGLISSPMPSNSYSSWQGIADDWMDEWSSLPTSSAKVLFAPFVARLYGGTRGDILAY